MIALSAIDQERFGLVIARDDHITNASLTAALDFCSTHGVRLLIARCSSDDAAAARGLEAAGARQMDTLIYYARSLDSELNLGHRCSVPIRPFRSGDELAIRRVAAEAFRDYAGHYHCDERLDRQRVAEIYPSWAERSCLSRQVADQVFVADDGAIKGFATLRLNNPLEAEGVLFAVAPQARGLGIYRAFMYEGLRWAKQRNTQRMVVSTQLTNRVVQRVWTSLGFTPIRTLYTFHVWFAGA
jgi:GNAT superfamily N-acetyltransferase